MASNYVTFRKFPDVRQAQALQSLLIDNGIECLFINATPQNDINFIGISLKEYEIQLKQHDFDRANAFLEDHEKNMFSGVSDDYYLLSFTDEELYDVLVKRDEWNDFDYVFARKLLSERGQPVDEAWIQQKQKQRLIELAKPESNHKGWIIAGYLLALLGGFFGVITGYVISSSRKTLPDGTMVYTYTPSDRAHGRIIFMIGLVMMIVLLLIRLLIWDKF